MRKIIPIAALMCLTMSASASAGVTLNFWQLGSAARSSAELAPDTSEFEFSNAYDESLVPPVSASHSLTPVKTYGATEARQTFGTSLDLPDYQNLSIKTAGTVSLSNSDVDLGDAGARATGVMSAGYAFVIDEYYSYTFDFNFEYNYRFTKDYDLEIDFGYIWPNYNFQFSNIYDPNGERFFGSYNPLSGFSDFTSNGILKPGEYFLYISGGYNTATGFSRNGDLSFNTSATFDLKLTRAVPEPATWAMMLTGFALAGAGIRIRKRLPQLSRD